MEAVPRLPMLNIPMKTGVSSSEITDAIAKCIRVAYQDNPELYQTELHEFETLRNSILSLHADFTGCSYLKRYYCQLLSLTARLPLHQLEPPIQLMWISGFDKSSAVGDLNYEMNCIMFNIAALHMSLGSLDPRTSADGMKVSCTHFQCAAWAFQVLADGSLQEPDLNGQLMQFLSNLALAQAQECILEKSMTDNRKPNIIAKVSMQVTEYFKTCMDGLENLKKNSPYIIDKLGQKVFKLWTHYCDMKMLFYQAVTLFHQGLHMEEVPKFGDRIAFYQAAVNKLEEGMKASKSLEKIKDVWKKLCNDSFTFANDVIQGKLTIAEKENEFVYHEKVPPISSLPEVKGASLVKGIPINFQDPDVSGTDIFARLVPMEAHQASSMYSEEKAKLLRRISSQIQEKNQELETYLVSMQLDNFTFDDMDALPQELVECCADFNSRDAFHELTTAMTQVTGLYDDIAAKLNEAEQLLNDEESEDIAFKKSTGDSANPNQIFNELRREISKYKEAQQAAHKNNETLHDAIRQHQDNIVILSEPWDILTSKLPSVAQVEGEGDKATRQEVQRLLKKVREMQAQRVDFEEQLRRDLHEDDITKELVTSLNDPEQLFEQKLQKHSTIVSLLDQNMTAQTNILQALSEANAAFASTRRAMDQVRSQRSDMVCSLISSYQAFTSICQKTESAKDFFHKLDAQVTKLYNRAKSSIKVQEEDRKERLKVAMKARKPLPTGPKLKDYLAAGQRPNPLGSEVIPRGNQDFQYPVYPTAPSPMVPTTQYAVPKPTYDPNTYKPQNYMPTSIPDQTKINYQNYSQRPDVLKVSTSGSLQPTQYPTSAPPVATNSSGSSPAVTSYTMPTNIQYNPANNPVRMQRFPYDTKTSGYYQVGSGYRPPYAGTQVPATGQTQYVNPNINPRLPNSSNFQQPINQAKPNQPVSSTPNVGQNTVPNFLPYGTNQPARAAVIPGQIYQNQVPYGTQNVAPQSPYKMTPNTPVAPISSTGYPQKPYYQTPSTTYNPTPGYQSNQWRNNAPQGAPYPVPQTTQAPQGAPYPMPQTTQAPRPNIPPSIPTTSIPPTTSSFVPKTNISNVDLLSDIDLSQGSQWSPLVPHSHDKPQVTDAQTKSTPNGTSDKRSETPTKSTTSDESIMAKLAKQTKRSLSVVDPLSDDKTLNVLAVEAERLSKFVQSLEKKSLNGPTNLEVKWKELSDELEQKCTSLKVSVSRCYPLKNRFADVLIFDDTRVVLPSARDDYINASKVQLKCVEENGPVIITQAPMSNTVIDFWTMIWHNQVELIACLNTEAEVKGSTYFPKEMGDTVSYGSYTIVTKQATNHHSWIQRTFHLTNNDTKIMKAILHVQFTAWPPGTIPESPVQLLQYIGEIHNLEKQQRNKMHPVVVHCVAGTGRSGVFVVLSSFINHLHTRGTLGDVWNLVIELCQQRRSALQDRSHLMFLYTAALYYVQDILMKRGILTDKASFDDGPREKTHVRHPSADLLSADLNRIKANLGFETDSNLKRSGSQSSVASSTSSKNLSLYKSDDALEDRSLSASPIHSRTDSPRTHQIGGTTLPPNLAASLDPNQLVIEPQKNDKITKDSFIGPPKGLTPDPHDPLGSLDPLWSIKK